MQSGPNRTIITVDTIAIAIEKAVATAKHKGCITTIIARRPQPPPAVPLVLRTRGRPRSALFCIYSILRHSCFTASIKLTIKSISRITCFCNGQKIHFIYGIFSTFCSKVWVILVHNCCVLDCSLFCRCKCRIQKRDI